MPQPSPGGGLRTGPVCSPENVGEGRRDARRQRGPRRPATPVYGGPVVTISRAEFEDEAGQALDQIPEEFLRQLNNIALLVEDEAPPDQPGLLGLYEGVPLPERTGGYAYGPLPDKITLFQGPLQRVSGTRAELRHQIAVTVVHEIGHYFGIDDDRLHELGWG